MMPLIPEKGDRVKVTLSYMVNGRLVVKKDIYTIESTDDGIYLIIPEAPSYVRGGSTCYISVHYRKQYFAPGSRIGLLKEYWPIWIRPAGVNIENGMIDWIKFTPIKPEDHEDTKDNTEVGQAPHQ